jgi:predicted PurR-regulated permease PerM
MRRDSNFVYCAGDDAFPFAALSSAAPPDRYTVASWIAAALLLWLAIQLRLVAALLGGLLVFELVHAVAPRLPLTRGRTGRIWAVALLAGVVVAVLAAAIFGLVAFFRADGSIATMVQKVADILDAARGKLPDWVVASFPTDPVALKEGIVGWLKQHAGELRGFGGEVGHVVAHLLIGMIIGAMVSLREALPAKPLGPLADAMIERARRVGDAFRRVVFAQVRISAINTVFTAIYLLFGLRLVMGIELPFAKTLVVITFLAGLLPVVGNLISNTVILVVSLSVSPEAAMASLAFLVVIHKLEYFLNARIVGTRIRASPWELLVAMLVMEAAFGIGGLAVAPVYYAYLKDELSARGLV